MDGIPKFDTIDEMVRFIKGQDNLLSGAVASDEDRALEYHVAQRAGWRIHACSAGSGYLWCLFDGVGLRVHSVFTTVDHDTPPAKSIGQNSRLFERFGGSRRLALFTRTSLQRDHLW